MTLSHAADVVGNALTSAGAAGVAVLVAAVASLGGVVGGVVAQIPAPTAAEQFWPVTVMDYIGLAVSFAALVVAVYGFYRFVRRPTDERFTKLEARLKSCEDQQPQAEATTQALRRMEAALASLERMFRDADSAFRAQEKELAHLKGAWEQWDGRERRHVPERRHEGRRRDDHHSDHDRD